MTDKQVCPHYDEDNICDCPYGFTRHSLMFTCPPAEQIKENLIEEYLDKQREHENEIERLKCNQGWNK